MNPITDINKLLEPHLFQVIGSTPASIRDSLKKIELRDKPTEGAYLMTVAIFSAAVNKATLETFLAKPEFAIIRPMVSIALSIQNRTNMTAFTLLGHCLMTSKAANDVTFVKEFRKKMGQDNLWAGNLDSGSLSDKQKNILKEKKRVTEVEQAQALGSGFVKWVGIDKSAFTTIEAEFWGLSVPRAGSRGATRQGMSETVFPGASTGKAPMSFIPAVSKHSRSPTSGDNLINYQLAHGETVVVPEDVIKYRLEVLGHSNEDVSESIVRNKLEKFIANTRAMMLNDPDGSKIRGASAVGGN
jgi:hypothetical protein